MAIKHRAENRSLHGVNEDSSTELTPRSRKKTIFRDALKITTKSIADLQFDETAGAVIIIFSVGPEKTGFIEKINDKYVFTQGIYER